MPYARLSIGLLCSTLLFAVACDSGPSDAPQGMDPGPHPAPKNKHEFISAEGQPGQPSSSGDEATADADSSEVGDTLDDDAEEAGKSAERSRTIEEGDIYRALGPGRLINLNPYRGLQVIDINDVTKPKVIGRLRESGQPVEMYMVGQRAIVMLNEWTGYYGGRSDIAVDRRTGGVILSVDLTDPTRPTITDRELIDGSIMTSRLTREGERATLYVAASEWNCRGRAQQDGIACPRTVVKSMEVTTADIVPRTTLNLGGSVSALQATTEALIVARMEYEPPTATGNSRDAWPSSSLNSVVNLVDITNIDGHMVEGAKTKVKGYVQNKFNLDLRGNVLRVVSSSRDRTSSENFLETFDTSDRTKLSPLATCQFGSGQQLYATLFMQDRAFFVTYFRVDPYHAFSIDAAGQCAERAEFVVSGWNDFFRPTFSERRLIGIGTNDGSVDGTSPGRTRRVAVSLYDITQLDNPSPLIARAEVDAEQSWSGASHDDKAFSVLEGAVNVPAPGNPSLMETGLVLVPFASWGSGRDTPRAGVQIFTFSESTLTRRGEINHGQPVERTFQPAAQLTANISAEELSLFDTSDPDAPVERGRVELAPSYSDVLDFGNFLVRVHDTRSVYGRYPGQDSFTPPPAHAEILPKGIDPESDALLAKVPIPAGSRAFRVETRLVIVSTLGLLPSERSSDIFGKGNTEPRYRSTIQVFELANPSAPTLLSSLTTDRLLPANGYGWGYFRGECGEVDGNYYDDYTRTVPGALVFGRNVGHQESIGDYEQCYASVKNQPRCVYDGMSDDCEWDHGHSYCSRKIGSPQKVCESEYYHCVRKQGQTTCTPTEEQNVATRRDCDTSEQHRYWQSMELDVLDLRNPAAPVLTPVPFAREEETVGLVASGASIYFAFKKPHAIDGDPRPFAKYYFREVTLVDPAQPAVGAAVNVPGELLAVSGDRLFTRDLRWGEKVAETHLHALRRVGEVAEIVASQSYADRQVTGVLLDGPERMLVTHRALARGYDDLGYDFDEVTTREKQRRLDKLTIYQTEGLARIGETDVDSWSDMTQVVAGRVLFAVPGGLLVVDAQNPAAPSAQAYFPYQGYQRQVSFDGASILVAAGPYGIHHLDATTRNLLMP